MLMSVETWALSNGGIAYIRLNLLEIGIINIGQNSLKYYLIGLKQAGPGGYAALEARDLQWVKYSFIYLTSPWRAGQVLREYWSRAQAESSSHYILKGTSLPGCCGRVD